MIRPGIEPQSPGPLVNTTLSNVFNKQYKMFLFCFSIPSRKTFAQLLYCYSFSCKKLIVVRNINQL